MVRSFFEGIRCAYDSDPGGRGKGRAQFNANAPEPGHSRHSLPFACGKKRLKVGPGSAFWQKRCDAAIRPRSKPLIIQPTPHFILAKIPSG
ncbi:hypothetical protein EGN72_11505 [Pseudorhodobacter sp. E13]|nr:hypothetical protein EGN72_11505 [Pseudorhodobacter sp. E13]